jgi:hypothetical protein
MLLSGALKHLEFADWFPNSFLTVVLACPFFGVYIGSEFVVADPWTPRNNSV